MRAPAGLGRGARAAALASLTSKSPPRGFSFFRMGLGGPFFFGDVSGSMTVLRERLIGLIEPLLERLGYELVELEYSSGRAHGIVRLFIDKAEGVGVADCERVSREVSALLDVEDPIPTAYSLEVSSPGFDRVLRTQAHFERFAGARVFVELKVPRSGRRRYTGTLVSVDAQGIAVEVDGQRVEIPYAEIGKARLAG